MQKIKILKLHFKYEEPKLKGIKPFEIRKNDKNYKIGDIIKYQVVNDNEEPLKSELNNKLFQIQYITNFMQIRDYIVFSEKELK